MCSPWLSLESDGNEASDVVMCGLLECEKGGKTVVERGGQCHSR
jgi:hypothetical protein